MTNTSSAAATGLPDVTPADAPRVFPDFKRLDIHTHRPANASRVDMNTTETAAALAAEAGMNAILEALTALLNEGGVNA